MYCTYVRTYVRVCIAGGSFASNSSLPDTEFPRQNQFAGPRFFRVAYNAVVIGSPVSHRASCVFELNFMHRIKLDFVALPTRRYIILFNNYSSSYSRLKNRAISHYELAGRLTRREIVSRMKFRLAVRYSLLFRRPFSGYQCRGYAGIRGSST